MSQIYPQAAEYQRTPQKLWAGAYSKLIARKHKDIDIEIVYTIGKLADNQPGFLCAERNYSLSWLVAAQLTKESNGDWYVDLKRPFEILTSIDWFSQYYDALNNEMEIADLQVRCRRITWISPARAIVVGKAENLFRLKKGRATTIAKPPMLTSPEIPALADAPPTSSWEGSDLFTPEQNKWFDHLKKCFENGDHKTIIELFSIAAENGFLDENLLKHPMVTACSESVDAAEMMGLEDPDAADSWTAEVVEDTGDFDIVI
eukprot:12404305-Karenia_brevis.AAC.1